MCLNSLLPLGVPVAVVVQSFPNVLHQINDEKQENLFQMFLPVSLSYGSLQNLAGFPVHLQQHGGSLMSFTEVET